MLKIRSQAVDAVKEARKEKLVHRIMSFLRNRLPEECGKITGDELKSFVKERMEEAEKHKINKELDLSRYALLTFYAGNDVKILLESENIQEILNSDTMHGFQKVQLLKFHLIRFLDNYKNPEENQSCQKTVKAME